MSEPTAPTPTPVRPSAPPTDTVTQTTDATGGPIPLKLPDANVAQYPFLGASVKPGDLGQLGPYRVTQLLGEGGMGFVFRGEDDRLRRSVALKVMRPEVAVKPLAKDRFLREGRAAAALKSDHIITIYDVGEANGVPYLAMEFLDGWSLDDWLKGRPTPPAAAIVRVAKDALKGLSAAHEKGMVHRDIKPANLWVEKPLGRVKVLDFGLARGTDGADQMTATGAVVGTPSYMSPEQAGGRDMDARSDLFSLGVVLYRALTGSNPFAKGSATAALIAVTMEEPPTVAEAVPGMPAALSAFVERLMRKDAAARPKDARAALAELSVIERELKTAQAAKPEVRSTSKAVLVSEIDDMVNQYPRIVVPPRHSRRRRLIAAGRVFWVLLALSVGVSLYTKVPHSQWFKSGRITLLPDDDGKILELRSPSTAFTPRWNYPLSLRETFRNTLGMEFVKVPRGTGWLGGGGGKPGETKVEFLDDFYLGKYEVTQEEWEKLMGKNPSRFSRTGDGNQVVKAIADEELKRFPVENVTWDDCQAFVDQLNKKLTEPGWVYRLPTEAEWEYACRGGPVDRIDSSYDFYFEKPALELRLGEANFAPIEGKGFQRPYKVGSYEANVLGLHDMHGNVWEWCGDSEKAPDGALHRVDRGGSWINISSFCRVGSRFAVPPSFRNADLGLRLARVPVGTGSKVK